MSYERAIKSRKEELSILRKVLGKAKKGKDKEKIRDLESRIELVEEAIDKIKKEEKEQDY